MRPRTLLAAAIAVVMFVSLPVAAQELFRDDFSNADLAGWFRDGHGACYVENGELHLQGGPYLEGEAALIRSLRPLDFRMEFDFVQLTYSGWFGLRFAIQEQTAYASHMHDFALDGMGQFRLQKYQALPVPVVVEGVAYDRLECDAWNKRFVNTSTGQSLVAPDTCWYEPWSSHSDHATSADGIWHHLTVTRQGPRITAEILDAGVREVFYECQPGLEPGLQAVAVSEYGKHVHVDNVRLEQLPSPPQEDWDRDLDGIADVCDNCPTVSNTNQADADHDGTGDACDGDRDNDGVADAIDNCLGVYNPDQADTDADAIGDACDACPHDASNDEDHDGVCGAVDNCPAVSNAGQLDADGDGRGDACDDCPMRFNPDQRDDDHDGIGNACDVCQFVPDPDQIETDGDGVGDACDDCPLSYNPTQADSDADGRGDVCDNCPTTKNVSQHDANGDGVGDECDLADGLLLFTRVARKSISWQADLAYGRYNLYRGSLAVLLAGGPYTQPEGSNPYAHAFCGLISPTQSDSLTPSAGEALYWLVTGTGSAGEDSLGHGAGVDRPNANPCR